MTNSPFEPKLWTPRSVAETQEGYAKWAGTYDKDVRGLSYATPTRIADALSQVGAARQAAVLDFGCGTGLSGLALREAGFGVLDGTDISPEMLAQATEREIEGAPLYRKTWLSEAGTLSVSLGEYPIIVATGVISLGAAPPSTLALLLHKLTPGGLLAFSYNDPTLADPSYIATLDAIVEEGAAEVIFRAHGPHLSEKVTGSEVLILRRL